MDSVQTRATCLCTCIRVKFLRSTGMGYMTGYEIRYRKRAKNAYKRKNIYTFI